MRSSIADYDVMEVLPGPAGAPHRYLCRPPQRLEWSEPVEVIEVPVPAGRYGQWSDLVTRIAGAGREGLRILLEAGPDPSGGGAFVSCEAATGGHLVVPEGTVAPAALSSSVQQAVEAVAAAARGAHALHEVGLAHGWISPAAICITSRGPVLAPPVLEAREGFVAGASDWQQLQCVDPDLLRGESPSRSSDIWSLAATLHLALTGRPLYPGMDADQAVTAVQRVMFTRPEIEPTLDDRLARLIGRCLEADPARRPGTAEEVADELAPRQVNEAVDR